MHIAKTGGTSANTVLPALLQTNRCAGPAFGEPGRFRSLLRSEKGFTRGCHFLTYEARLHEFRSWFDDVGLPKTSYRLLATLRDPLSHWISAGLHMFRRCKEASFADPTTAFGTVVELAERNTSAMCYKLQDFQMRFFHSSLGGALTVLREETFWFGLTSFPEISYGLLQCQLHGIATTQSGFLHAKVVKNQAPQGMRFSFSNDYISRLVNVNRNELLFYSLAVSEFWLRVSRHANCLRQSGLLTQELEQFLLPNASHI